MIKRIKDVITYIGSGTTPKSGNPKYYDDALIPWLNSGDLNNSLVTSTAKYISEIAMQDYPSLRFYPKGSVVVAMYGASIGKTGILNFQTTVNQACCVLTPDESQISSNFLHLLLQLSKEKFLLESFGGTQPNISQKVVANLLIDVPSLEKQNMITSYLDKECEKISRNIELLERKADAYKRLRRSIINRAVTRGLNPNVPLKPSDNDWIGDIPVHWNYERVEKCFHHNTTLNKNFEYTRAFKFYMGTIVPKNENLDEEEYREAYEKYTIVEHNDIMINGLNLNYDLKSMRVGIVPYNGIITSAYVVLRPFEGINAQFFNYLFKAFDYRKFFHGMGKGVRLTLSFNELRAFEIPIPPDEEQDQIVAYLDEKCGKIDAIIEKIVSKIERLKELKRSLINETVTGKRAINNH